MTSMRSIKIHNVTITIIILAFSESNDPIDDTTVDNHNLNLDSFHDGSDRIVILLMFLSVT